MFAVIQNHVKVIHQEERKQYFRRKKFRKINQFKSSSLIKCSEQSMCRIQKRFFGNILYFGPSGTFSLNASLINMFGILAKGILNFFAAKEKK